MVVDYEGSSPQSERGINVVLNYTTAYTTFGVKCAISPEVPNNDGSFQPIKVTAPEGSIFNAVHPAPVGGRHIIGHFLPGLVHGALAKVVPGQVLAQGADSLWNTQITGQRADGEPFTYVFFSGGGMGARPESDGLSATAFPSGIRGVPAEVIESISPVVMHRREFRPDSEGPGRHRGGFGQEMELGVRSDSPWTLSAMYDRTRFPRRECVAALPEARAPCASPTATASIPNASSASPPESGSYWTYRAAEATATASNATPTSSAATLRTASSRSSGHARSITWP